MKIIKIEVMNWRMRMIELRNNEMKNENDKIEIMNKVMKIIKKWDIE